jgi:hypothetical protein
LFASSSLSLSLRSRANWTGASRHRVHVDARRQERCRYGYLLPYAPLLLLRPTLSYVVVWLGTWNNWQGVIPLNRSEHDFTAIIDLPPGVHQ